MQDRFDRLFGNHLEFLRTHRAKVRRDNGGTYIESDRPEFTYAVLEKGSDLPALLQRFKAFNVAPWSGEGWEPKLEAAGVPHKGDLTYMSLPGLKAEWPGLEGLKISVARDTSRMNAFSEVQGRGFLSTPEAYGAWQPWLNEFNQRNVSNPNQYFYVGDLQGQPVGCVLLVVHESIGGIYAVATLPEHRKKGISTAIMKRAVEDAVRLGCTDLTLQTFAGSYAESFYLKLGFVKDFTMKILSR